LTIIVLFLRRSQHNKTVGPQRHSLAQRRLDALYRTVLASGVTAVLRSGEALRCVGTQLLVVQSGERLLHIEKDTGARNALPVHQVAQSAHTAISMVT
jgi:hypothetical protein